MKHSLRWWLLLPCLVAVASLRAGTFEGKLAFTMQSPGMDSISASSMFSKGDEGKAKSAVFYVKGRNIRMEVEGMVMIFAWSKLQSIALMPAMKMYMVTPVDAAQLKARKPEAEGVFTATGRTTTLLGYKCHEYVLKRPTGSDEMWVTRDLGSWENLGGDSMGFPTLDRGPDHRDDAGIPLLSISRDDHGKLIARMEVTKVEVGPLADSLFEIPAGYTRMPTGN